MTTAVPFEILVSTMMRSELSFLEAMFPEGDYKRYNILVINQTDAHHQAQSDVANVRVINTMERGLPQSRNMAIAHARGTICLVADDDVVYEDNFEEVIVSAFAKAPTATVITFQMVKESGGLYQNYPDIRVHTQKTLYTVNGVVIAFDRQQLKRQNIGYNNHFGLGATFGTANEYVFMKNVLKAGAQAHFEPRVILSHPDVSSGRLQGEDRVIYGRAALKYKEYGVFAYLWIIKYLRFLIARKYIKPTAFFSKLKIGLAGIKKYRHLLKTNQEER